MTIDITLKDADAIARLNKEVAKSGENLWVHDKIGAIMVDAKSLLGLMPFVGQECKLVAEDNCDPNVLFKIAKKAKIA